MHYDKAPITEALIDIQVELPPDFTFDNLKTIKPSVASEYPREQTRTLSEGEFTLGPEIKAEAKQKDWGLMYFSQDGRQVFQANLSGFTFSRLEPYETWERFRSEAKRLWEIYRDHVHPQEIKRVAVRYLNQFNFPAETIEPEEYLNTYPQMTKALGSDLRNIGPFLMTLHIPQTDLKGMLIINEALASKPKIPQTVPFILDLDLFIPNPSISNDKDMWDLFERLRERKNLYFEACITDKTRELIQ